MRDVVLVERDRKHRRHSSKNGVVYPRPVHIPVRENRDEYEHDEYDSSNLVRGDAVSQDYVRKQEEGHGERKHEGCRAPLVRDERFHHEVRNKYLEKEP